MKAVLLTRPKQASADLAASLSAEGIDCLIAPLMDYEELPASFDKLSDCQALVFTSAEAVHIFSRRIAQREHPVFAVGDATAQAAARDGFAKVWSASGDAADVARLIVAKKEDMKIQRVFHACGEDIAQDLAALLAPHHIGVERATLYRMTLADHLPPQTIDALQHGDIGLITFFSARAAECFCKLAERSGVADSLIDIEALCLSPRVAEPLKNSAFGRIQVTEKPDLPSMVSALRETMASFNRQNALYAPPVIAAFGGIRQLASRIEVPPSTVQGWKKRGTIPASRVNDILSAAGEDGIDMATVLEACAKQTGGNAMGDQQDNANHPQPEQQGQEKIVTGDTAAPQPPRHEWHERRHTQDRRQKYATPDRRGHVHSDKYAGPDRRSGIDRREYLERQKTRIRQEKWAFVNRTMLTFGVLFFPIVLAGVFILAPEYLEMKQNASRIEQMQAQMDLMNKNVKKLQTKEPEVNVSLGAKINAQIERVENAAAAVGSVAGLATTAASTALGSEQTMQSMLDILSRIGILSKSPEGRATLTRAVRKLQSALQGSAGNKEDMNTAVALARKQEPALDQLMGNVTAKDMGAAAMLIVLNEFRSNVSRQQPFEKDLALLSSLAGNDPAMLKSLQKLAPYARNGVLSEEGLRHEFKGVAMDIVMAKLKGEDASVQQKVMQRMSKYVKMRKVSDINGKTTDAIVARAQLMLDKGDTRGAMAELSKLEGAPAETATPFMEQAAGSLAADDMSSTLTSALLQQFTGSGGDFSVDGLFGIAQQNIGDFVSDFTSGDGVPYISPALQADPQTP